MNEFERVREVILRDWDPIGIGDNPNLAGEYDSYIPGILKIMKSSRNADAVASYLGELERELCLSPSDDGRNVAARKLVALIL